MDLRNYWNLPSPEQNTIASEAYPLIENPCIRFHTDEPKPSPVNPCIALYGSGPEGQPCKDCIHLRYAINRNPNARYWKCDLRKLTHGTVTDHRVNWQSCGKYERRTEPYHGG